MAAVRFRYLPREREAETGAAALGRVERQPCLSQHGLIHARTAIAHFDALLGACLRDRDLDAVLGATGFVRVLEQVDERLLELRAVEPSRLCGQRAHDAAMLRRSKLPEKQLPIHGCRLWCGKPGEGCIPRNEIMKMLGTLGDRAKRR